MSPSTQERYRRRRWIVNLPLQWRFVRALLFVIGLMTTAAMIAVYVAIRVTLSSFELARDPVMIAIFSTMGWTIVIELLVLVPLVFCMGILLSHKVAGPLVRIQAALKQMESGEYNIHIKLRKGDALVELAEMVNHLAESLRRRHPS